MKANITFFILALITILSLSFGIYQEVKYTALKVQVKNNTYQTVRKDTIFEDIEVVKEIPQYVTKTVKERETIYVKKDDTTYIAVPREIYLVKKKLRIR